MAEQEQEQVQDGSAADAAEFEAEALEMGWAAKDNWRGDPDQWVDAKTFVERGRHVLPILRKNNQQLHQDLAQLRAEQAADKQALKAATAAIKALEESYEEDTQTRVKVTVGELKEQIAAASERGDHKAVAELTEKLVDLKTTSLDASAKAAAKTTEPAAGAGELKLDPAFVAWAQQNPWYGVDMRRTRRVLLAAQEMREEGDVRVGVGFMDAAAARADKELGLTTKPRGGDSKVSGGNGGGGRTSSSSDGKSYTDLPADAKTMCDAQAKKFVGEGRRHKTVESWRKAYATQYFAQE